MDIEVTVPPSLRDCAGCRTSFTFHAEAETLDGVLRRLFEAYPQLRTRLYDERDRLRPNVLLFHNHDSVAWLDPARVRLHSHDQLSVISCQLSVESMEHPL